MTASVVLLALCWCHAGVTAVTPQFEAAWFNTCTSTAPSCPGSSLLASLGHSPGSNLKLFLFPYASFQTEVFEAVLPLPPPCHEVFKVLLKHLPQRGFCFFACFFLVYSHRHTVPINFLLLLSPAALRESSQQFGQSDKGDESFWSHLLLK